VLFNLIENSLRHTPPEGVVTVRASRDGGELEVEVHDTGNGIPADQRLHVFEPFARGDDAGSGLGLAISRAIVEAHGGRIWLADADRGTSVRFRIPALA
jgi:signal transduction histidine kinase